MPGSKATANTASAALRIEFTGLSPCGMPTNLEGALSCAKRKHTYIAPTNEPPRCFADNREAEGSGVQQLSLWMGKQWVK
jgi:hypothetical protein